VLPLEGVFLLGRIFLASRVFPLGQMFLARRMFPVSRDDGRVRPRSRAAVPG
jgi:hypothetical protein